MHASFYEQSLHVLLQYAKNKHAPLVYDRAIYRQTSNLSRGQGYLVICNRGASVLLSI
jgi:hypothetical protein